MKHEQDLLNFCAGEGTFFGNAKAAALLTLSPAARRRRIEYLKVMRLFAAQLGDPDSVHLIEVKARASRPSRIVLSGAIILTGLMAAGFTVHQYAPSPPFHWVQTTVDAVNSCR